MRKVSLLVIVFAVCLLSSVSYAASIGNKIEPIGNMKFAATVEGNFMFDRDIKAGGSSTSGSTVTSFEFSEINQEYAKLMLGVTDYVNIYAKLGGSKIGKAKLKFSSGEDVKVSSDNNFLYGGGFNAVYKLGNEGKYFVGLNGDFSFYQVNTDKLDITGTSVSNVSGKIKNAEYQLGGYAGMRMDINNNVAFVPYAGVFWSRFNTKTGGIKYTASGTEYTLTYDNDAKDEVGLGVGADVELFKNFTLNVEGRFLAGNAVSFGGTFKF
ncbi:MAG: autotransporter domain-containing protein [Patescibacteria group bacterium]